MLFRSLGSFGMFGIGWLIGNPKIIGNPVGGVYWLMNVLLPGYSQFRYPAKLLVVAAIPFAILAAYGFDQFRNSPRNFLGGIIGVFAASLVFLAILFAGPLWSHVSQNVPNCPMFGPFQTELAKTECVRSLLHTMIVLALLAIIAFQCKRNATVFVLILVCGDLYAANYWLTPTASRKIFAMQSPILKKITETHDSPNPPRIYRYSIWYPAEFRRQTSPNRLAESVAFDRISLWPKYSLEHRVSFVDVRGTMSIQSHAERLQKIRASSDGFEKRLSQIGVEYVILPYRKSLNRDAASRIYSDAKNDFALWKIMQPGPIAWLQNDMTPAKVVSYEPNRIVLEADGAKPQTLVLAEQYWPGWKASVVQENETVSAEIFPVETVFRGVNIPAGQCRVVFQYDPPLLKFGAACSLLAWCVVFANLVRRNKNGYSEIQA